MEHGEEVKEGMLKTIKALAFAAWALAALFGGSLLAANRPDYWRGTLFTMLALAVPPLAIAAWRHLVSGAQWAGRKIRRADAEDEAVSPVIAVILMVAITVVLAATVWVWVSGFSAGGGQQPAGSISLVSNGHTGNNWSYVVSSASAGLRYDDLNPSGMAYGNATQQWSVTRAGTAIDPAANTAAAGDAIMFHGVPQQGQTVVLSQRSSNSVLLTLMIPAS